MNKVILMGRLTRDPETRYPSNDSDTPYAKFTLAVNRRFTGEREQSADFINCVTFGNNNVTFAEKYLKQGSKICICGRIRTGSYTNKERQKVYTTEVVVEEIEFAESKKDT